MLVFLLSFISLNTLAIERALFAVDVIRHGDRTLVAPLPNASYPWIEGPDQLTAQGMQKEFLLGTALRKKYINKYHLLPVSYMKQRHQTNDHVISFISTIVYLY